MRPEILLPPGPDFALRIKHRYTKGWRQRYFLTSDVHWDSPECYFGLYKKHLEEARETDSLIIDNGDFFDVIGSARDPRGGKGSVIPEVSTSTHLDDLVELAVDEFYNYADQWVYAGRGNHDAKIVQMKETDIMCRWIDGMNEVRSNKLPKIHLAEYTGWIRFMFESDRTSGGRSSLTMKLEHGTGGNSPVTKGVIGTNRRQVRTHGATFYVTGHIHESWIVPAVVETLNLSTSRVEQRLCQHVQLSSYKMDFRNDGKPTWIVMKSGDTKPIGGAWLEFFCDDGESINWRVYPAMAPSDYPKLNDYLRPSTKSIRRRAPVSLSA